jgi:hypothetical protein
MNNENKKYVAICKDSLGNDYLVIKPNGYNLGEFDMFLKKECFAETYKLFPIDFIIKYEN